MRVPRLYSPLALNTLCEVVLVEDAAHYIAKVLRLRPGDQLRLFNGKNGEYLASIVAIDKRSVTTVLQEQLTGNADPTLPIHLGLGVSRGERMDYAIQKATETGVSTIVPLLTERCEIKLKNDRVETRVHHWQRVAISASEQSGRCHVPDIAEPLSLSDWLAAPRNGNSFVLDHRGESGFPSIDNPAAITLLIGPEGGLSEQEVTAAASHDFCSVSLGPRVLRTETAPVVAIALVQHLWGDY